MCKALLLAAAVLLGGASAMAQTHVTVGGNVYGGGNLAGVGGNATVTVNQSGAVVTGNIYGGCNSDGTVTGDIDVNILTGTFGTGSSDLTHIFGGGYGAATATSGNVTVTIGDLAGNKKPTIYGDIYGGSAEGSVNNEATDLTKVDFLNGTLHGNIYGGGLGLADVKDDEGNVTTDNSAKGQVNGEVQVNISKSTQDVANCHIDLLGCSIYGCNNTNGSPQDNVTVHIYKTANTTGDYASQTGSSYAIDQVFGGGNRADYLPEAKNANSAKKATVHIHDCVNTVRRVFSGGNAAAATGVAAVIEGGRYDDVFGGGNGEVTAANIGLGGTSLTVHAGKINRLFGGSNSQGTIAGTMSTDIDGDNANTGCAEYIAEFFGGGNMAPVTGDIETTIDCGAGEIGDLYGGANLADIDGNVTLTVKGGTFNNVYGGSKGQNVSSTDPDDAADISGTVTLNLYGGTMTNAFGGSNINGNIGGKIIVNVLDHEATDCELNVTNIYGGGNLTPYTPNASVVSPIVNVMHIKQAAGVSGKVYGGGKGFSATVTANPQVNIGYNDTTVVRGDTTMADLIPVGYPATNTLTNFPTAKVTSNVYGGGDEASVAGSTTILMQHANSVVSGDVYGGGNLADVSGSTTVTVDGGTVMQDVYGGGALADVNVTGGAHTTGAVTSVTLNGGSVRYVYGGGLGRKADDSDPSNPVAAIEAKVYGPVTVTVTGGSATSVFGCNNLNGAPQDTVAVIVNKGSGSMTVGNVYGGGNQAAYSSPLDNDSKRTNYPAVWLMNGTVGGDVFGGGLGSTAGVTGNPRVNVKGSGVSVTGGVYGGGSEAPTTGNPTVTLTSGALTNVYGGGRAANVTGAPTVNINGGTVSTGVYGGCNTSGIVSDKITVSVTGGTIGAVGTPANVHGGGYGNGTSTTGDVAVTIDGASAVIWGDVYGGSALGSVNDDNTNKTEVTLTAGTLHGDLYGGGLGQVSPTIAALVNGKVQVKVEGGTVTGSVYGCNNKNGAPQDDVKVDIYASDAALTNVFGGGNLAAYTGIPAVTIHGCDNSINYVYGGGNQASVGATNVTVYGGTIGEVYGGGYGQGVAVDYVMVSDTTHAYIHGGTIGKVFGGNNASGTISVGTNVKIDKQQESGYEQCDMKIGQVYGGGNLAASAAGTVTIGCTGTWTTTGEHNHTNANTTDNRIGYELEGVYTVYGGANEAAITGGNIVLNINKGIVREVFGGNNVSGSIAGGIQVNIEQTSSACDWYVGDVYGGGDKADYGGTPDVNIKAGTVSGSVYGGGNNITTDGKGVYGSDVEMSGGMVEGDIYGGCNIKGTVETTTSVKLTNGRVKGSVYGGGYGANTVVTGKATVDITGTGTQVDTNVYGGGNEGEVNDGADVKIH